MIYIKKYDIISNKPKVLEQEIYCMKIFHWLLYLLIAFQIHFCWIPN